MLDVDVQLDCAELPGAIVLELEGSEAMNALSSFRVRLTVAGELDAAAALRAPATLALRDREEGTERRIGLLVIEIASEIVRGRDPVHEIVLSDPAWLLTRRAGYRVFVEQTTARVVTQVLADAGIPARALEPRLAGTYPVRPQCVQYGEPEWSFIERSLAEEGISYWFEADSAGEPILVLGDDLGSHRGIDHRTSLPFAGSLGALSPGARAFSALEWEERVVHDRVVVRDFDVRRPGDYLDGESGDGDLVYFEYPAGVATAEAASFRARRRLDQLQRDRVSVRGDTNCIRIQPGRLLDVAAVESAPFDQRMLVAEVRHRYARPLRDGGDGTPYRNHVTLKPTRDDTGAALPLFRPPLPRLPALEHVESAVVTGPPGEEVHVDDLGRIKLRFLWDRTGPTDDRSSYWTRCLQVPLGGAMFLPRVGWEVAVGYLDGSPDRPFVIGRLYNATAVPPFPLPGASATTAFQSWTTPRNGATQGIRMSDDAGGEVFGVQASKDYSLSVGAARRTKVDGDEEHTVGLSLTANVLGSSDVLVGADQSVDVGAELIVSVDGASAETIAGAEVVNVGANRVVLAASRCVEKIGATYGLVCNQSNVNVTGSCARAVAGDLLIAGGLGVIESVAASRSYVCRGSRTIRCASHAESITGAKRSSTGAARESAVGIGIGAASASLSAGSLSVKAGGKVSMTAPVIRVEVSGELTAAALALGGGALRVKTGISEIIGFVTRSRGGEVGS